MTDPAAPAIVSETPVNPYSLLEAVNRASRSASLAWLALLAVMAYLSVAVAGISHRDLLLDTDVVLPILQTKIGLKPFLVLAPLLFVLLHLTVIARMALVARTALEFAGAIRLLEVSDARTHPLRHELDTFFVVQAIAGPERSRIIGALLHALAWLTLVLLPICLLLYVQTAFLPYHAITITFVHRLAVLADLALLALVGIFLLRPETSFFWALVGACRQHGFAVLLAAVSLAGIAAASLFLATIPGERLDQANLFAAARLAIAGGLRSALGHAPPVNGSLLGPDAAFWPRNLIVSDLDLVAGQALPAARPSINLRGRDLRFAKFDRSDLRGADLSGANLDGASFVGADLRGAIMQCFDSPVPTPSEDRHGPACTSARKANFARARLAAAKLAGIDLREANLEAAHLEDAHLPGAILSGANLSQANLARANFSGGAQLRGAELSGACLQGTDLSGAQLQLANFSGARMQAADLSAAGLEGAQLRNAELDGANLAHSILYAVELTGARLAGADLTAAAVWRTAPPASEQATLADMTRIVLRPPRDHELAQLSASSRSDEASRQVRLAEDPGRPGSASETRTWAASAEQQGWLSLAKPRTASEADQFKSRLTGYLIRLMCLSRWADGAVAAGIARRAMAPGFSGDLAAIHERLKSAECPASPNVGPRLMHELGVAVELARASD
jgi:uncharacterized protein YjbI with pentapeptide repeats